MCLHCARNRMPDVCNNCGKEGAPSGTAPNKYCKAVGCQDVGKAAGHIKEPSKRARSDSPASSCSTIDLDDHCKSGTITKIERIYGVRWCDPRQLGDVEYRNGVDENDEEETELPAKLAYLLCGHFETNEKDKKGWDATRWVSYEDLDKALPPESVDAAIDAFEASARDRRGRAADVTRVEQ